MELKLKLEAKLIICPSTQTILRMVQIARPNGEFETRQYDNNLPSYKTQCDRSEKPRI